MELYLQRITIYYHLFFCIVFSVSVLTYIKLYINTYQQIVMAFLLSLFVSFYIGLVPIPFGTESDRDLYYNYFNIIKNDFYLLNNSNDKFFFAYMKWSSFLFDYKGWFILTSLIYCFNHFFFALKSVPKNPFLLVIMFFSGFMFLGYGVNTVRAGFAASFLLLALANYNKFVYFIPFIFIAVACHFSMIIPAFAIIMARFYNNSKLFLFIWLFSIPTSFFLGNSFEAFFSSLSSDSRVSYLSVKEEETQYNVGFRLDFIIYSCIPIIMGYYYIIKRGLRDYMYSLLFNTYVLSNSFWILVIRANFSDRFAYLSWFLYPVILIYPMLKYLIYNRQNEIVAVTVFLHGLFTYIMFLR